MKQLLLFSKIRLYLLFVVVLATNTSFSQELYPISENGKQGLIDSNWQIVFNPQYEVCTHHAHTPLITTKKQDKWSIWDINHTAISNLLYDSLWLFDKVFLMGHANNKVYIHTTNDGELIKVADSVTSHTHKDVSFLKIYDKRKVSLLTQEGHFLERFALDELSRLDHLYYLVKKDNHYGILHKDGTPYLEINYDSIYYNHQVVMYKKEDKMGLKKTLFYLNSPNEGDYHSTTIPAEYVSIAPFGEHFYKLKKEQSSTLYHIKKQEEINQQFPEIALPFTEFNHKYKEDNLYGLLDVLGNKLTEANYNKLLDSKHPNVIIYQKENKYGYMNAKGKEITSNRFDFIAPFEEYGISPRGFTKYKIKGNFGLINISGDTITSPKYTSIKLISNDKAACILPNSSVRVFILDPQNGNIEDYYDLIHYKLLKVKKYYYHTSPYDLEVKIAPHDNKYFAHKILHYESDEDKYYQYNTKDYSFIETTTAKNNLFFFKHSFKENTFAPADTKISIESVDTEDRPDDMPMTMYAPYMYKEAKLVDESFVWTKDFNNEIEFLDLNLEPLIIKYKEDRKDYELPVIRYHRASPLYQGVLTIAKDNKPYQIILKKKGRCSVMKPIYDSLLVNGTTIYGRGKGGYWKVAAKYNEKDSLVVPNKTTEMDLSKDYLLSKRSQGFCYIYNKEGKKTISLDSIEVINESYSGYVLIKKDTLFNYLNPKGELVLDKWIKHASSFQNGFASVKAKKGYDIINSQGEIILKNQSKRLIFNDHGLAVYSSRKKKGLIDSTGKFVENADYSFLKLIHHSNYFSYKKGKSKKMGILTPDLEELFPNKFTKLKSYDSTFILFQTEKGVGLINSETKEIVIPDKFSKIKQAGNGFHIVHKKGKYGLYSNTGAVILKPKYSYLSSFKKYGFITAKTSGKNNTYVTADGTITKTEPERIPYKKHNKEAIQSNDEHEFIGVKDKGIPAQFHHISQLKNGCYIARRKHYFTLTTHKGELVLESEDWIDAKILNEQVLQVKLASGQFKYYDLTLKKWVW